MKNYLRDYLTPNEQRVLILILLIGFISLLVTNKPLNHLYSEEVSPDSIKADIETPYKLCLDIRTASKKELIQIKGIGEKTADKIIAFRDSVGIVSNYDLLKINGIGEKGLIKWLPYLKPLANDSIRYNKSPQNVEQVTSREHKIDINKAQLEDLMKIKGIGEKKAHQIIEFRTKQKGLNNMQELLSIKGIGKKTLAKIEELFYIGLNNE